LEKTIAEKDVTTFYQKIKIRRPHLALKKTNSEKEIFSWLLASELHRAPNGAKFRNQGFRFGTIVLICFYVVTIPNQIKLIGA